MRRLANLTLFNVFYSTTFSLLFFLLSILLIITPGDCINQIVKQKRPLYNIVIIGGCYLLTLVVAMAIYGSRLYTVKALMGDIPREYVPIKKGDLPGRVHGRITAGLGRSAVIAYESRPRAEATGEGGIDGEGVMGRQSVSRDGREGGLGVGGGGVIQDPQHQQQSGFTPQPPIWGKVSHLGFSPPDSPDLPFVQYSLIIAELPHLIEKKVLSIGTLLHHHHRPDTTTSSTNHAHHQNHLPLLRRRPKMSLRAYITYLQTLGYIDPGVGSVFTREYERARFFSVGPLAGGVEEGQFRRLMKLFAILLREMDVLMGLGGERAPSEHPHHGAEEGDGYSYISRGNNDNNDRYSPRSPSASASSSTSTLTITSAAPSTGTFGSATGSVIARPSRRSHGSPISAPPLGIGTGVGVLGVDITHPFFEQFLEGDWESGSTEGEGGDREQRLRRGSSSGSGGGGSSVVMAGVHITHNSNRNMEWRTSRHRSDQPNDELSRISTRSTNRSDHTTTTASSEGGGVELGGASVGVELTRFSTVDSGSSSALSSLATRRSRNIDPRVKQRASSGTFG